MTGLLATISGHALSILGAGCLIGAALAATMAVSVDLASPGRRVLLSWTPIAVAVIIVRYMGWPQIAVGLIFGTSVALLSVGLGSITAITPIGPAPQRWRRIWPFTLVAALLVFLSGFTGSLPGPNAIALLVEGLIVFSLWNDPEIQNVEISPRTSPVQHALWTIVWIVPAICLAGFGAYFVAHGTAALQQDHPRLSPGVTAASVLSPCLIVPLLLGDRHAARSGASWIAVTSLVGIVLLNLCLLLPLLAMGPYVKAIRGMVNLSPLVIDIRGYSPQAMIYPWGVWRLDAMLLVIISAFFVPVGLGKWNLTRRDGVALSLAYLIYLMVIRASAS